MRRIVHDEAFTGLEAAIVLIAFVVVAAVFSYVVLGAGFFTTQKAQEAVKTGVEQSSTALQIKGAVLGIKGTTNISIIRFTVEQSAGGEPIDMSKVTMTYITASAVDYLNYSATVGTGTAGTWNAFTKQNDDGDSLLEKGEVWTIQANLNTNHELTNNEAFKIEIRPSTGAVIPLSSRGPAQIDAVNSLTI
ncbi:MAG: flagellin [Methanomicrobiales archaeon]|nr:flagellin [Methanomicrobiales archaeon]